MLGLWVALYVCYNKRMFYNAMNLLFAQGNRMFKSEMSIKRINLTLYIHAFDREYFSCIERFVYKILCSAAEALAFEI